MLLGWASIDATCHFHCSSSLFSSVHKNINSVLSLSYAACVSCCDEGDLKQGIGSLYCWGYGGHGNLGLGDRRDRLAPELVAGQVCVHVFVI
jgi:alpha-tubulin suppressor-like RCC1 family protein